MILRRAPDAGAGSQAARRDQERGRAAVSRRRLSTKAPKTVNNVLTVLSVLLKKAVEWDVIERMPCTVKLLPVPKASAAFYDFDEYERLVDVARARSMQRTHLDRAAGWGGRASVRRDDRARVGRRRSRQAAALRPAVGLERPGDDTEGRTAAVRAAHATARPRRSREHRHLRSPRVLCQDDGTPLTRQIVQNRDDPARRGGRTCRRGRAHPASHVLLAPGDARGAAESDSGARRTSRI